MADIERDEYRERVLTELAEIRITTKNTLTEATKTNGRVTSLENRANSHDILHAIDMNNQKKSTWWKEKFGTAIIGIICAAIGFSILLVLQKTQILNTAIVSFEAYKIA